MEEAVLLADPKSRAWRFAKKIQDWVHKEREYEIPLRELEITEFRNGEYEPYVPENVRKKDVYFIQDSTKDPSKWWVELLLVGDLLNRASANSVTFVLPDMPWNRQDRKAKPHVPISAKALAYSISPYISRIISMDLHADQIQGFYEAKVPLDALKSFPAVVKHIKEQESIPLENLVLVAADGGGVTRVAEYSQALGLEGQIATVYKIRDRQTKESKSMYLGDVKGSDVFIIDDIIDSGTSTCEAGRLAKENGAKRMYCYATHGLFTKGTKELRESFDVIMTSNTHCYETREGIDIIDVSSVFADAIYRAQVGESISSLFALENSSDDS